MKNNTFKILIFFAWFASASCQKMLDINKDPDALASSNSPIAQLLTSAQVNLAFDGGSDLYRFSTLIMQHMSGGASQPNQTYEYGRYNIQGSDQNNVWSSLNATTLSDLELILQQATTSPHYLGVAKVLKAYQVAQMVDVWGKIPFSDAQKGPAGKQPLYDDDAKIYTALLALLTEAVTDLNATTSVISPGTNSVMYPGAFSASKANWMKLANTLKLRLLIHYSKKDPSFTVSQITALVNSGASFMASNADNFKVDFFDLPNQRSPISAFEVSRPNYLFADKFMLDLMGGKNDPRRATYFTNFPVGSSNYTGVSVTSIPAAPNNNYSRIHSFLRGTLKTAGTGTNSGTYTGAAPQRLLPYAEYCFIRAEAALMGAPGDAQTFYQNGITASMQEAGVAAADITTYIAANGTLSGSNAQKLKQIIEEKYVALFGVSVEPWTDWRRTGYPSLTVASNAINTVTAIPRTFFYPQSEIDQNPNCPGQKNASLQDRVFWDTP